eukprot:CAMPEP_0177751820 /NCGR_PEP_ID=MMETSP0491_2-20121128/587_1 /TAXON_ID=63592 /ORGANISM="Tetraselmis chuii, Strain PLY429" /LENGTH=705 /DNA_ID=CAMNT_0019266977 /DNA_START=104 /DNA_END=2221 /DNA_ORIENTATION=+
MEAPSRLADWWCSLYTLFLSSKGLKLRITIPDTFIIRNGQLTAWFQTSDEGYVHRLSPQKLTPENVFKTLLRKEMSDPNLNPHRFVAIAHFSRHASRLLRREELDILLGEVDPPGTPPRALMDGSMPSKDLPYCIQGYVPPIVDMRYVTTYTMEEGASCTTFARRFSSRYTHAHTDSGSAYMEEDVPDLSPSQGPYRGSGVGRPVSAMVTSRAEAMSPQPARPHSSAGFAPVTETGAYLDVDAAAQMQLNAQHEFDSEVQRRQASGDGDNGEEVSPGGNGVSEGLRPVRLEVDHKARAEIRRLVQSIVSFVERAHGLRLVGMVAETTRCCDGSLLLLAIHATQWDMRHTRGSMATYTERMNDYRSGLVAPPASQPGNRSPTYSARRSPKVSSPPLPHLGLHEAGERQGVHDRPWTSGAPVYHPGRPDIQPLEVPSTPESPYASRFGTPATHSRHPSRSGYSTRSASPLYGGSRAYGGIRAGAGGSPSSGREISPSPKTRTWTPRTADAAGHVQGEGLNRDVVAGLADDLEATKECLQMQYDAAARAEAALAQLQGEHTAAMEAYQQTTSSLEMSLVDTQRERDMLNDSAKRLTERNRELEEGLANARAEADELHASLTSERETNTVNQRAQNQRDAELRSENERIREELNKLREEKFGMKDALSQEQEVVAAVRTQLVEYKLYIQQLEERNGAIKNAGARIGANK